MIIADDNKKVLPFCCGIRSTYSISHDTCTRFAHNNDATQKKMVKYITQIYYEPIIQSQQNHVHILWDVLFIVLSKIQTLDWRSTFPILLHVSPWWWWHAGVWGLLYEICNMFHPIYTIYLILKLYYFLYRYDAQYFLRNIHTGRVWLCFVVVVHQFLFSYHSGLRHVRLSQCNI